LEAAITDQDVVISCLGLRRRHSLNPWSKLLSPPDLTTRVVQRLVPLMQQRSVHRLLVISAGGVGDSVHQLGWPVTHLIRLGQVGVAYRDLASMEDVLANSALDWLAVRPVTLMNGAPTGHGHPVARYQLWSLIRRSNVAAWMVKSMEEDKPYVTRRVLLGTSMVSAA
jgi:hypothetical protein